MKKFLTLLIIILFGTAPYCYAASELYYLKNIKTSDVEPIVSSILETNSYNIVKNNPYYAISEQYNDRAVIILQQSGDNMFYYFKTEKNPRVNKLILKEIKKNNVTMEQSFSKSIISIYDDIADTLIKNSGIPEQYIFSDESQNNVPEVKSNNQNSKIYSGYIAQVASGTTFSVYLQNAINTANASQGDEVVAVLQDNITYNGVVVIPQGSLVYGTLTKARSAGYGSISGKIVINFNKIVTLDNQVYYISTENIEFAVANEGKAQESVKNAASTAAIGAVLGLLFGLLSDNGHAGRSAAIGAGIGAGSSLVKSVAEKGVDAEIPSFTELEVTLTWPLNVNVSN